MGLIKKQNEAHYWTVRDSQATPFFAKVMPFWFHRLISRMLHLSDNSSEVQRGQPGYDPWAKIRPVQNAFNTACKQFYVPSRNISIDESLVGMKNRTVFIQYMPNKRHARFGIKKFQLCDVNGYVFCVEFYAGKDLDVTRDDGLAVGIVKALMEQSHLLRKGYHLFTDNFYTKPALAQFLWEQRTMLTGTVRGNSKDFPKDLAAKKLAVGESVFQRKGSQLAVAFREKKSQRKPVLLLSTAHVASSDTKTIRGKTVTKPSMVLDYNENMGGIDLSDKKIYHFAAQRSTRRYWKKLFFNLLDMSILNAWIIFNSSMPQQKRLDQQDFIISVVEALCGMSASAEPQVTTLASPARQRPNSPAPLTPTAQRPISPARPLTPTTPQCTGQPAVPSVFMTHRLLLLDGKKERDCYVCSKPGARKRSRHWCPLCEVGCHEKCEVHLKHTTFSGRKCKRHQ